MIIDAIKELEIPTIGMATIKALAVQYNLRMLFHASLKELEELDGVGKSKAKAIVDWFDSPRNRTKLMIVRYKYPEAWA